MLESSEATERHAAPVRDSALRCGRYEKRNSPREHIPRRERIRQTWSDNQTSEVSGVLEYDYFQVFFSLITVCSVPYELTRPSLAYSTDYTGFFTKPFYAIVLNQFLYGNISASS